MFSKLKKTVKIALKTCKVMFDLQRIHEKKKSKKE